MTLDPAVHCSRVRKPAVGIANGKPITSNPRFYFTGSPAMFSRLITAIH